MSRLFVESFFPATRTVLLVEKRLGTTAARIYEFVFPAAGASQCPEVVLFPTALNNGGGIRNPVLGVHAAFGLVLGAVGGVALLERRQHLRQQSSYDDHDATTTSSTTTTAWSMALICFGLMNAAALPLHCLVMMMMATAEESSFTESPQTTTTTMPEAYPLLWWLDTYFTGASAVAIVTAARREITMLRWSNEETTADQSAAAVSEEDFGDYPGSSISVLQEWMLWNVPGVACLMVFLLFSRTLPLELWYLLPTVLAFWMVARMLWLEVTVVSKRVDNPQEATRPSHRVSNGGFGVAAVVAIGGLLLDAPFCRIGLQAAPVLDTFMVATNIFAASNVFFAALFWRLWNEDSGDDQQRPNSKKTR